MPGSPADVLSPDSNPHPSADKTAVIRRKKEYPGKWNGFRFTLRPERKKGRLLRQPRLPVGFN